MIQGRLIKGYAGFYYVECADEVITCKARGILRKLNEKPVIGDFVMVEVKNGEGALERILPRKNRLSRPSVSNVDCVAVLLAKEPKPDVLLIDKLLIQTQQNGARPILCVNKCDLGGCGDIIAAYAKTGFETFVVSAKTGEGVAALKQAVSGLCVCFAGQSGVGKSSVINLIADAERMETGVLSEKSGRGKHTTRHVELLKSGGGYIVDTPGFSLLEAETLPENIDGFYPEFAPYIGECRFAGCEHRTEPGCMVKQMCESGEIPLARYQQYLKLLEERKRVKVSYD